MTSGFVLEDAKESKSALRVWLLSCDMVKAHIILECDVFMDPPPKLLGEQNGLWCYFMCTRLGFCKQTLVESLPPGMLQGVGGVLNISLCRI